MVVGFHSSSEPVYVEHNETFSPKTKKKLSKKPSFIKNAVLDLFRSKSKKVSRQKSLCEADLQGRQLPMLRREKSDMGEMNTHMRNQQIRNQMLQRSNSSSCEKPNLRPILKTQSTFCDESGVVCTVRDYDTKPVVKNLRRQNSMCEIDTEPKVTPLLRRQNSLIEYNRRGIYGQNNFNMITKIDPIYQRQQQMKHEPFHPTQPLPPEPTYQSKDQVIYDPIPKPRRTYTSMYDTSSENPYASRSEMSNQSFENPYGSRHMSGAAMEPPYATRAECMRENPYGSRHEAGRENPYATRNECSGESPYATRNECNPYATREECMRENPYATKIECHQESPYATRSECVQESPYATRNDCIRENPYASRNECVMESPYATKNECMRESPYATRNECRGSPYSIRNDNVKSSPYTTRIELKSESPYATKHEMNHHCESRESPYGTKSPVARSRTTTESPYTTKEEMLRQRFSESPYSTKEEMLKQRMDGSLPRDHMVGKRTYDPPPGTSWSESPYGVISERRLQTPVHFTGRVSPLTKCMSEPPYASRSQMSGRSGQIEPPYVSRAEIRSASDSPFGHHEFDARPEKRPASAECTYVSRQEILSQKAALLASRESAYGIKLEEKLEIIKQRNQAKKEMIYQTRKEANESDSMKIREPLYVSKRELKDSVIYESHQEVKENSQISEEPDSTFELSETNHLSRRSLSPLSTMKLENLNIESNDVFQEIDFSKLRLTESQTDAEKEKSLKMESKVLIGEPIYTPRLPVKPATKDTDSPVPFESTTSMDTHYASECSMNFENKPQSTPYASTELEPPPKPSRTVTFCEQIAETSQENSDNISNQNETTIVNNQNTVIETAAEENAENKVEVQPEGPHTTWGIFDSEGGVLEDRQWGVSLIIPPKAIAPGIKQKIYFTVTDPRLSQRVGGPPIDMDNGEAMLSPLVMCGPQGLVFLRPVTLRLPHCANAVPSLGLTIKATDTEAHLSTDWDQIHLPATTTLNTVAVKVDHF